MKKITTAFFSLVGVLALAGCGGETQSVSDQDLVDLAISNASILVVDGAPALPDNVIELDGATEDAVTLTTMILVKGYEVSINWMPNSASAFTFDEEDADHHIVAHPVYPEIGSEENGAASLTATAVRGDVSSDPVTYTFTLVPAAEEFLQSDLSTIRYTAQSQERVWVQGQVTYITPDFNIAYIQENGYGIGLYKLDTSGKDITLLNGTTRALQVGDYVKAIGEYSPYNGLAEVSFLESLVEAEKPANFTLGDAPTLTATDFQIDPLTSTYPITGLDCTIVNVNGLTLDHFTDKNGTTIASLPTDGSTHANAICYLGTQEVSIYISYHIGVENQTAIAAFFSSLSAGQQFNYHGLLGWYTTPNLSIMSAADLSVAS